MKDKGCLGNMSQVSGTPERVSRWGDATKKTVFPRATLTCTRDLEIERGGSGKKQFLLLEAPRGELPRDSAAR